MSRERFIQALAQAADEVLGTMFFSFVDRIGSVADLSNGPLLGPALIARVSFQGPVTGTVRAYCGQRLGLALSANFLGEDEGEVGGEVVLDAFKELTNMVVGRFLAIVEPERVCELGLPEVGQVEVVDLSDLLARPEEGLVLDTGDDLLAFDLRLKEGS